jgi:predicted acyltransferase (DUF342 family)
MVKGLTYEISRHGQMIIAIVFILFILMLVLPFLPGMIELVKKEDADPLFISMNYKRSPRYLGNSFRNILQDAIKTIHGKTGFYDVHLSKKEQIEIRPSSAVASGRQINHLVLVRGDLFSDSHVQFNKEIHVVGNAAIGPNNVVQALSADGNVAVGDGTLVRRWLDAEGDIDIAPNCHLGISVSAGGQMKLSGNCFFHRLFAMPIVTGNGASLPTLTEPVPLPWLASRNREAFFMVGKQRTIPPRSAINTNMVFHKDIQIGANTIIRGDIKAYGMLVLEDDVTIDGNLFADGDIVIGKNARISGHTFSQGSVFISTKTIISRPNTIKSIIGKKSIQIEKSVIIHGYVSTEGRGLVI